MEVRVGMVLEIPERSCLPIADGRAVVVRTGSTIRAFPNRCLHQDSPLAGGWIREGVLTCPQHFWRYAVDDGRRIGSSDHLTSLPVRIDDDVAWVDVPEPPAGTLREQLLARARGWDRDQAYRETNGEPC